MISQIEIEYKTLLTKTQYLELINKYKLNNNIKKQINYYFDTTDYKLYKEKKLIRVRQKEKNFFLYKKETIKNHVTKETKIQITSNEFDSYLKNGIKNHLLVNFDVFYIGSLTTYRTSFKYKNVEIFLDYNLYLDKEDYELECEVTSNDDYSVYLEFLNINNLKQINIKRKQQRLFDLLINHV